MRLPRLWAPIRHLHAVADNDDLRRAHDAALLFSRITAIASQHRGLLDAYRALSERSDFAEAEPARRMAVEQALRAFRLAGIELEAEAQQRYREISQRLSELGNRFSQNLLDATDAFALTVPIERLAGLPDAAREKALAEARAREVEGAVITFDGPTYMAVMSHAEDRAPRRAVYEGWVARASAFGERPDDWDNAPLIDEMIRLREEQAGIAWFPLWAERQLEGRMADSPAAVVDFLGDLARRSVPQARDEFAELQRFALEELGMTTLEAWDVGFVSEHLRHARYAVSQEAHVPGFRSTAWSRACSRSLVGFSVSRFARRPTGPSGIPRCVASRCCARVRVAWRKWRVASTSTSMLAGRNEAAPGWMAAGAAAAPPTAFRCLSRS